MSGASSALASHQGRRPTTTIEGGIFTDTGDPVAFYDPWHRPAHTWQSEGSRLHWPNYAPDYKHLHRIRGLSHLRKQGKPHMRAEIRDQAFRCKTNSGPSPQTLPLDRLALTVTMLGDRSFVLNAAQSAARHTSPTSNSALPLLRELHAQRHPSRTNDRASRAYQSRPLRA